MTKDKETTTDKKIEINWEDDPNKSNFPAALSYLTLIYDQDLASKIITQLENAPESEFAAKAIFRASRLPMIGISNHHMVDNRQKITDGKPMSPILLVRDIRQGKVVVADGYHRLCAVYSYDEDAVVPCRIVSA